MSEESSAYELLNRQVQRTLYDMGWESLQPIQEQSIRAVYDGAQHLLISAHTAAGKTEAGFLPVVSTMADRPMPSVQALYVGPLKALINDQFRRLEDLCRRMELPVHRWHGDVEASRKQKVRNDPSGILLITTESLESCFLNYGNALESMFRHLEFVVIDELHAFLDNVRGVHLRSLIARLEGITGRSLRLVGLSATLGDLEATRSFLCPGDPASVLPILAHGGKRDVRFGIKASLSPAPARKGQRPRRLRPDEVEELGKRLTPENLARLDKLRDVEDAEKYIHSLVPLDEGEWPDLEEIAEVLRRRYSEGVNLVFVNAKRHLETLAALLRQKAPEMNLLVHHGSLSRDSREEAEKRLRAGGNLLGLCSSTLEMGIDIGKVARVGQVDPPWTVASMMQRLGRSGRRKGEPASMQIFVRDETPHAGSTLTDLLFPRLLHAVALGRLMREKWLEPPDLDRMHLSTLIHQVLSLLKQTGGAKAVELARILIEKGAFVNVEKGDFRELLRGLGQAGYVEQRKDGLLILAPEGEKATSSFDFYAAFEGAETWEIQHAGKGLGQMVAAAIPAPGECFLFAGRAWRVMVPRPEAAKVEVEPAPPGAAPTPTTAPGGGELVDRHARVIRMIRDILADSEMPGFLDEAGQALLSFARGVARSVGLPEARVLIRPGGWQWFPWIGTRALRTLEMAARLDDIKVRNDGLSLMYLNVEAADLDHHWQRLANGEMSPVDLAAQMPHKCFEKFDKLLPEALRDRANARDRLEIEEARTAARELLDAGGAEGG